MTGEHNVRDRIGRQWYRTATVAVVLLLFAVPAFLFLGFAGRLVAYPHAWENGEGICLFDAQQWYAGRSPYRDPDDYPYLLSNYPPVYSLLWAAGMALTGPGSFSAGRLISLLALLGMGYTLFKLARYETRSVTLGLVGCLGFFTIECVIRRSGPVARVDQLAAALSFAGFYLTYRHRRHHRWVLPVIMFFLAGFTKQTAVTGCVACLGYLWVVDRSKAVKSTSLLLVTGLGALGALTVATDGAFWRDLVTYTWSGFEWAVFRSLIRGWLFGGHLLFAVCATLLVVTTWILRRRRGLLLTYLSLNVLGLALLGKVGASYFYMIEPAAALSLSFPILVADLWRLARRRQALAASVVVGAACLHVGLGAPQWWVLRTRPEPGKLLFDRTVCQVLAQADGPVLAEDIGWLLIGGKQAMVNPAMLTELGAPWRYRPVRGRRILLPKRTCPAMERAHDRVLADILAQRFALIQTNAVLDPRQRGNVPRKAWQRIRLLTDERFSPDWQRAIAQAYELKGTIGMLALYEPKPRENRP